MKWGIFLVLFMALFGATGCVVSGLTPVDLSAVSNVNGGLGSDALDYSYVFAGDPPAELGQLLLFVFIDGSAGHYAAGMGYMNQHPVDGDWYVEVNYVGDLGPNAYDLTKYHAWTLQAPENPPVSREYLPTAGVEFISYWPQANALELYWLDDYAPNGGYGLPPIPFGTILEVQYLADDASEPFFRRACVYEEMENPAGYPVARCAFYAPVWFGIGADDPDLYQIRVVERAIPN